MGTLGRTEDWLFHNDTFPSWGFSIRHGATSIWERWDGWTPENGFQDPGMNSFNHYAYGAIGDWMYRVSAGIEARSPGYKDILIQPHVTEKLNYSKASFESSYGTISSGWERKDGKMIEEYLFWDNQAFMKQIGLAE